MPSEGPSSEDVPLQANKKRARVGTQSGSGFRPEEGGSTEEEPIPAALATSRYGGPQAAATARQSTAAAVPAVENEGGAPLVWVKLGEEYYKALLDTGSMVSLLHREVVTGKLKSIKEIIMQTAGNGRLGCNKRAVQSFQLGGTKVEHDFYVTDSELLSGVSIILGYDLIQKLGINIENEGGQRILLKGVPLQVVKTSGPLLVNVVEFEKPVTATLCEDIVICKSSMQTVKLVINSCHFEKGKLLEVAPTKHFVDNFFPRQLVEVQEENTILITLFNFSNVDIPLEKGQAVVKAETVKITDTHANNAFINTSTNTIAALTKGKEG